MAQFYLKTLLYLIISGLVQVSWAAPSLSESFSIGLSAGPLVTSGVKQWDHIATTHNLTVGIPLGGVPFEVLLSGASAGEKHFGGVRISVRGSYKVTEDFAVLTWIGPMATHYEIEALEVKTSAVGLSVGGGLLVNIDRSLFLRMDTGVYYNPGTNAHSTIGLVWVF